MEKLELKKLVNKIIKKSFPILKEKEINLYYSKIKYQFSGGAYWILPFLRVLFINRKRNFTVKELKGLIAHELCHFEIYEKRGWILTIINGIWYYLSPKFRRKEEDLAEKLAIQKGYARETYVLTLKVQKIKKNISKYYATANEIKSYAKKIGKW